MTALLDEVLEAHGGLEQWRRARTVHARVRGGGLLIRTRVPGNRFADSHITVHVQEPRTVFDPFPRDGERGVFQGGKVRIERHDGEVLSSRQEARAAFFGRAGLRRNLRWDPLDSVYFAGYAMWNYLTFPYLLTRDGVEVSDGDTWPEGGETWRRLDASFPPDIDTHSRRQTFYVDAGGRLRRHDYVPEVIGRWARSAHYCADHVQAGGLLFPTRRWVLLIGPGNRSLPFPATVSLQLTDVRVENE
jgi:hypothetical protein